MTQTLSLSACGFLLPQTNVRENFSATVRLYGRDATYHFPRSRLWKIISPPIITLTVSVFSGLPYNNQLRSKKGQSRSDVRDNFFNPLSVRLLYLRSQFHFEFLAQCCSDRCRWRGRYGTRCGEKKCQEWKGFRGWLLKIALGSFVERLLWVGNPVWCTLTSKVRKGRQGK